MKESKLANELAGRTIKEVFHLARGISELHSCLTSPRGDYLRLRMLQAMETPVEEAEIEKLQVESGVEEHMRHLNKLLNAGLVSAEGPDGERKCARTELGERAVNAVREFQRSIGIEEARVVYSAAVGPNSIRLFLRIYGNKREPSLDHLDAQYTPAEVGRMSLFLPRIIEGVSAVDKLSVGGLFIYSDDGYVYMPAVKARAFYRYLRELYEIVRANGKRSKNIRQRSAIQTRA